MNFDGKERKESKKIENGFDNNPSRKTKHAPPLEEGDTIGNLMTRWKIIFHRHTTPHAPSKHGRTLSRHWHVPDRF